MDPTQSGVAERERKSSLGTKRRYLPNRFACNETPPDSETIVSQMGENAAPAQALGFLPSLRFGSGFLLNAR